MSTKSNNPPLQPRITPSDYRKEQGRIWNLDLLDIYDLSDHEPEDLIGILKDYKYALEFFVKTFISELPFITNNKYTPTSIQIQCLGMGNIHYSKYQDFFIPQIPEILSIRGNSNLMWTLMKIRKLDLEIRPLVTNWIKITKGLDKRWLNLYLKYTKDYLHNLQDAGEFSGSTTPGKIREVKGKMNKITQEYEERMSIWEKLEDYLAGGWHPDKDTESVINKIFRCEKLLEVEKKRLDAKFELDDMEVSRTKRMSEEELQQENTKKIKCQEKEDQELTVGEEQNSIK